MLLSPAFIPALLTALPWRCCTALSCFDDEHYLHALGTMLVTVVLIILVFTYYISVAKDLDFKKRFWEMALISLSVAAFSFVIGLLVKEALGIDI